MNSSIQTNQDFFESVKHLDAIGELFDLQTYIKQEVTTKGISVLVKKTELIIDAIISVSQGILLVTELLQYVCKYSTEDADVNKRILNQFTRYLTMRDQRQIRTVAMEILSEYRPKQTASRLIDIARESSEQRHIQVKALQCLMKTIPETSDLLLLLDVLKSTENELILLVMDVLERHSVHALFAETQQALEHIVQRTNDSDVRCRAIELLGIFGDIDIIEKVCMLPLKEPKLHEAVYKMIHRLLVKPCNILALRPENFEHIIKEWLIKAGYQQVEVTRSVRDEGVDVIAYKKGDGVTDTHYKVIVQCKRYTKTPVNIEIVEQFIQDIQKHQAKEGLLITTSKFTYQAEELAQHHQYMTLIAREALQMQFDKAFGKNCY